MRTALTPDLIEHLRHAVAGCRANLAPAWELPDEIVERDILLSIAGFMALTGGGWPKEQRQEFQDQAAADLCDLPGELLIPAIVDARRTIYVPARFVPTIRERLAERVEKLTAERDILERLAVLAGIA